MDKQSRGFQELISWVVTIGAALGIAFLIITFIGEKTRVNGSSMLPTLHNDDQLVLDKLTYRFRQPKRFEIIVFPGPTKTNNKQDNYVKRVIGLPGDTIEIKEGKVYVNQKVISKDYARDHITSPCEMNGPITLGEKEYFVLGDNRGNSEDSRFQLVGTVKRSEIIGRVILRIYPWKRFGKI